MFEREGASRGRDAPEDEKHKDSGLQSSTREYEHDYSSLCGVRGRVAQMLLDLGGKVNGGGFWGDGGRFAVHLKTLAACGLVAR